MDARHARDRVGAVTVFMLWMWFVVNWTSPVMSVVQGTPQLAKDFRARLVGGQYLYQGRVEIKISDEWGAVCDNEWNRKDVDILCHQLGFPGASLPFVFASIGPQGEIPVLIDQVDCKGDESNLGECHHTSGIDCEHSQATAWCQAAPLPVRIVGRVEVQYDSQWIPVCQGPREIATAEVLCRQLGFQYIISVKGQQPKESDIEDSKDQLFLDFECDGQEEYLAQCQTNGPRVGQCTVAEVTCSNYSSGKAGEIIRLSSGDARGTGHLEVNAMGEWWSICRQGLDLTAAKLACRQLGFQCVFSVGAKDVPKRHDPKQGRFGNVKCKGTERTLGECEHYLDETYVCPSGSLAEITCSDLPDYEVRLVGGTFPYEGRVEVSYNGQWGTICDDSWGYADADVVCQQLGFYAAETMGSTLYFDHGSGPIFLDDVTCLGNETSISECSHAGIKEHNCNHNEDVGIRCHVNKTQFVSLPPERRDSILPLIVILINGFIALLILVGCFIYCYLKIWDRYTGHTRRAHLRRTQDAGMQVEAQADNIPVEYTEEPPPYHTVHENRDVYLTQRPETPPPEYSEAMKLQAESCV